VCRESADAECRASSRPGHRPRRPVDDAWARTRSISSRGVDGCGCSEVCFPDVCCVAHRVSLIVPPRKAHIGLSRTCLFHPTKMREGCNATGIGRTSPRGPIRVASISARPPCGALWRRAPINTIGRVLRRPRRPCEVSGRGDFPFGAEHSPRRDRRWPKAERQDG
jgi:hypothetical protein